MEKLDMCFEDIVDRLKNRAWIPMADMDAVDMIVDSYMDGIIDEDEKEMLLDLV